jgi:2,3-bisphosphoglycerate-independent phosphoglycerate mutase
VFEQDEAYKAAIAYVLESIGRFAGHVSGKDTLFIVLGDHQPPLTTARRTGDFGVPIHVFSRDRAAIEKFLKRDYVPGVSVPLEGGTPMEDFLGGFLADFSSPQ